MMPGMSPCLERNTKVEAIIADAAENHMARWDEEPVCFTLDSSYVDSYLALCK
jgi:hypothetical protein